ncbi:glutaredoxin [Schizopora paradoxa]|uniref:Glutaredoxin n=1 Tax=Schizopora paradoxa TaxID=27342 RepID=A0A0H2RZ14_9AGAM|nr:glutaredoxin [Schizopora paradoxa]
MSVEAPSNLIDVSSSSQFQSLLSSDLNRVSVLYFWASWAEPCKAMSAVVREIAAKYPALMVLEVERQQDMADIAETFGIEAVPTFILLRGHTLLSRIDGADAQALTKAVAQHAPSKSAPAALSKTDRQPAPASNTTSSGMDVDGQEVEEEESKEQLFARLQSLMSSAPVMLFMKGTPDVPRCGFSRTAVGILREKGVRFGSFDILADESVRSGLKELNEWPTFPQLVVNSEFVGGLDILKEMVTNGEFEDLMKEVEGKE